eukprot:gene4861-6058_t
MGKNIYSQLNQIIFQREIRGGRVNGNQPFITADSYGGQGFVSSRSTNNNLLNDTNDNLVRNMGLDYVIPYRTEHKCPFWLSWSPDNLNISLATNESVDIFESNSGELLHSITDHSQVVSMVLWLNKPYKSFDDDDDYDDNNNNRSNSSGSNGVKNKKSSNYNKKNSNSSNGSNSNKRSPQFKSVTSQDSYNNSLDKSSYHSFVTCSLDNTIKIYQNYKLKMTLTDHKDWLKSLAITYDDQQMLSGCASSVICGWDLSSGINTFRINKAHPQVGTTDLNTINSLKYHHHDNNIFVSGSRYGSFRMWDCRVPLTRPLFHVQAHNKLNTLHFTYDDQKLLTSGRDGLLKLWDIRTVQSDNTLRTNLDTEVVTKKGVIREYRGHKCGGYNIGCAFFNNDRNIVTGSEDHHLYIYETESAQLIKKNLSHKSAVHLLTPANSQNDLRIATCEIESCNIHIYAPQITEPDEKQSSISTKFIGVTPPDEKEVNPNIKGRAYIQRVVMEKLMLRYGDQLFQFYHKHNLPPTSGSNNPEFVSIFRKIEKEFVREIEAEAKKLSKKLGSRITGNNNNNNKTTTGTTGNNNNEPLDIATLMNLLNEDID